MLNLFAFIPGRKNQYLKYRKAFLGPVNPVKEVALIMPGTCSNSCEE